MVVVGRTNNDHLHRLSTDCLQYSILIPGTFPYRRRERKMGDNYGRLAEAGAAHLFPSRRNISIIGNVGSVPEAIGSGGLRVSQPQ